EGGVEVPDEVVARLDPDRQPQERWPDARIGPGLGAHGGMRHRRGMRDEALHAPQGFGEREAAQSLDERLDGTRCGGELEADDSTKAPLLARRDGSARVVR